MGYDAERFVGHVNEGLLCCICRDVLEEPLQAPCEHAFCSSCIHGWLVHENCCPEDRTLLFTSQLKQPFRYMRNDLNRLPIRCRNADAGCEVVCNLEFIHNHEEDCGFVTVPCPSPGCTSMVARRELDTHMAQCQFRLKECPKGCGMPILDDEDKEHSCVAELRTAVELLRSEMICKLEDQKKEYELRLDAQRSHMVQREGQMQTEIDTLQSQVNRLMQNAKLLMETLNERQQDIERLEEWRKEMANIVRTLQEDSTNTLKVTCIKCHKSDKVTVL